MTKLPVLALLCSSLLLPLAAHAGDGCDGLPNWQQLKQALANPRKDDNIVYLDKAEQANGFKHPMCGGTEDKVTLPPVRKR
mgnify:CR=1 FL=1